MVSFSLKVRFYETDLMGVVHHANYLRWFEMGRVEYLRQAGIDLNEMMGEGFMVPIVSRPVLMMKSLLKLSLKNSAK